jgi:hypothetical protein
VNSLFNSFHYPTLPLIAPYSMLHVIPQVMN